MGEDTKEVRVGMEVLGEPRVPEHGIEAAKASPGVWKRFVNEVDIDDVAASLQEVLGKFERSFRTLGENISEVSIEANIRFETSSELVFVTATGEGNLKVRVSWDFRDVKDG